MTLYDTLGVPRGASQDEIKRAYRKLARQYHPDVNPEDRAAEDRFKEISAAFEVLQDPQKRKLYDELGEDAAKIGYDPEKAKAYRRWREQGRGRGGGSGGGEVPFGENLDFDLGDLFGDLFRRQRRGGGATPRGPIPGADITSELAVDFADAVQGAERTISLEKPVAATTCAGAGTAPGAAPRTCTECSGSGVRNVGRGPLQLSAPCSVCGGSGQLPGPPCSTCRGTGQRLETVTLSVRIPPGVKEGQKIRLAGQGVPGRRGGAPGDLYLTLRIGAHPLFTREGNDLHLQVPVTVPEAMFGTKVEIPTLNGPVRLDIPPGTQSGRKLRLRGKGVPEHRSTPAGDLYVTVSVRVPEVSRDPEAARKAAELLEGLYAGDPRAGLFEGGRTS